MSPVLTGAGARGSDQAIACRQFASIVADAPKGSNDGLPPGTLECAA